MDLVSIIIPVFNVEKYLSRCLDSLLAQTYHNFELILVDDGSPDSCGAICDSYAHQDPRIKVIHKANGGLSSARNAGMEIAQGKYYLFCDSDDYVSPDWCANLVKQATDSQDNFIFGGFVIVDMRTTPPETSYRCADAACRHYGVSDFLRLQTNGKLGFACNVLYYANILKKYGLKFSQDVIVEDLPFNLSYLKYMNRLTYAGKPDYYYVQYTHPTLSRKYYTDGFKRWQEKYSVTMEFIMSSISPAEQSEIYKIVATSYLYNFLKSLNNTFDKRNTDSWYKKIRYNSSVVNSKEFQHCLLHADTSKEDHRYISLLRKRRYIFAYLLQLLAKQKSKLQRRKVE